jgi:CRP/FNR family transcriptional regulator
MINTITTTCLDCRLSDLCLPHGLDISEIETLEIIITKNRLLQTGETLYAKNDQCLSLFAVKSGSFRRFISNEQGDEQTMGFYLPSEIMGLDALFEGKFGYHVSALETSSVCELPLSQLNELCIQIPSLQHQLKRILSKEIGDIHQQLTILGNTSAKAKMAMFLLMLSKRYASLGYSNTTFNLSMRRQDIGNFLGLSNESISRQLTALSKEKIITVNQRAIHILDLNLLQLAIVPESIQCEKHSQSHTRAKLLPV